MQDGHAIDIGTLILDPGHGGSVKNGGSSPNNAVSVSGVPEKVLVLDFCLILRDQLLAQAAAAKQLLKVVLTRTGDVNPGIAERAAFAARHQAAALICLHFNGHPKPAIRGAETFYAAAANGNANLAEDMAFARAVHAGLLAGLRAVDPATPDRGCKPDTVSGPGRLGILGDVALGNAKRARKCVAAYVEAEFITNPVVDRMLISGPQAVANRTKALAILARAIRAHVAQASGSAISEICRP